MYKLGRIFSIFLTNFTINKRLCGLCLEDGGGDLSSIVFTKIFSPDNLLETLRFNK